MPNKAINIAPLQNGLVLQARPVIEENESGLLQTTLNFHTVNENYPRLKPGRGVACNLFTGDPRTNAVLALFPYLGAQTNRWTRNGKSPGIGILEVLCQGALFTQDGADDSDDAGDPATWIDPITAPLSSTTTTRETTTFGIYDSTDNVTVKAATTVNLAGNYYVGTGGVHHLEALTEEQLPAQDGVKLNYNDRVLVKNQTNPEENGIYRVGNPGQYQLHKWNLKRDAAMDQDAEVVTTLFIQVASGDTLAHTVWQCASDFTSAGDIGTDDITFTQAGTNPGYVAAGDLTIDYHTIDLHFEYVAKLRAQAPRFIQDQYTLDDAGLILIDPANDIRQKLIVLSAFISGGTGVTEDLWRTQVKYVGDSGRFEQTPAGPYWRVLETTQIKIMPILPLTAEVPAP